jgi:hypothetical protein
MLDCLVVRMKEYVLMRRPSLLKVADARLALILVDNVGKGKVISDIFNNFNWAIDEGVGLVERVVMRVCIALAWLKMFLWFWNRGGFTRRETGECHRWVRPIIQEKVGGGRAQR